MTLITTGAQDNQYEQEEKGFDFTDLGTFSENRTYTHRVIAGPKRVEFVWYPCIREDVDTGEPRPSFNRLALKPRSKMEGNQRLITDRLAAVDKKIQESQGVDKDHIESTFDRTARYIYIVISRDKSKGDDIWVGGWEYPSSVSKQLRELQAEESTSNKGMLNVGPYYTYDVNITRKKVSGKYGVKYSLNVEQSTVKYAGQIPTEVVNGSPEDIEANKELLEKVQKDVFTPEELKAVNEFMEENSLDDLVNIIDSDEEVLQAFQNNPINLLGQRQNQPIFKYDQQFKSYIQNKFDKKALPSMDAVEPNDDMDDINKDDLKEADEEDLKSGEDDYTGADLVEESEEEEIQSTDEDADLDDEVEEIDDNDIW